MGEGGGAGVELESARLAEKAQTLLYRRMAALAEVAGLPDLAARFHDLHADEQHHLSRLTARVLELGGQPAELGAVRSAEPSLDDWQETVGRAEAAEIERYRALLAGPLDRETHRLIEEILAVEEHHAEALGGKWTMA